MQPDLWKFKGRVHDERGQGGQEGAKTDTCREERWRGVVVGPYFPLLPCLEFTSCSLGLQVGYVIQESSVAMSDLTLRPTVE